MSSLKFKNPETGKWEKIRGGGSASLPVKVNILETICEDITLNDENPSYTLPTEITLDENALYYLDYKLNYDGQEYDEEYGEEYSDQVFSKVDNGHVQWLGREDNWGALTLSSTDITDTWREAADTATFSIYRVSVEVTDNILLNALTKEGYNAIASGVNAHAEGSETVAAGAASHAEGWRTRSRGEGSHAEGAWTTADGTDSHAEGSDTWAEGAYSHVEGYSTNASGVSAHAEGTSTEAEGESSHAEGRDTKARGDFSHAEGYGTIARGPAQHVQGLYNIEDTESKYLHIVGNGNEGARSNAHTLDWDGNAWFAGDVSSGWLKAGSYNRATWPAEKFVVQDGNGWFYHRTAEELRGDIGAAEKSHASQHASGGSDPITPAAIGAMAHTTITQELLDNPAYPTAYIGSCFALSGLPFAGHWRVVYLPYHDWWEGYGSQIAVGAVEDEKMYVRNATGTTWGNWVQFATTDQLNPVAIGAAYNGICSNIDTHDLSGIFGTDSSAGGTFPSEAGGSIGVVIHRTWDVNYKEQVFLSFFTGQMYHRIMRSGTWEDWQQTATTDYALNKAGDTMTGELTFRSGAVQAGVLTDDVSMIWRACLPNDWDRRRTLILNTRQASGIADALKLCSLDTGNWVDYPILHTGNKPSGSYTGNGSITSRTISTGGIGNAVVITSNQGTAILTFGKGIIIIDNGLSAIANGNAAFSNGTITLATTNAAVNASGVTYTYQVL